MKENALCCHFPVVGGRTDGTSRLTVHVTMWYVFAIDLCALPIHPSCMHAHCPPHQPTNRQNTQLF